MSIPVSIDPLGTLGASPLPPGYTLLQCLVAHGTEYVDTGITQCVNFALEFEFDLSSGDRILGGIAGRIPGLSLRMANSGTSRFGYATYINGNHYLIPYNSRAIIRIDANNITVLKNKEIYRQEAWGSGEKNNFTLDESIKVFSALASEGVKSSDSAVGKGYGVRAWSGTTLILDLVPALNPDGEPVMYDLVGRVERPNLGTGNFGYETL